MSVAAKFDYACSLPIIADRCQQIINIIQNEISRQDFAMNAHHLFELIFGLKQVNGSGDTIDMFTSLCVGCLTTQNNYSNPKNAMQVRDAEAVLNLLRPN